MDLCYINTRVRAWKGKLLQKDDYEKLLSERSVDSVIDYLRGTVYGRELELAKSRVEGLKGVDVVDLGIKENLFLTCNNLRDGMPADGLPLLRPLFAVWDACNIKTILRGIERGLKPEEIYSKLFPVGDLDEAALKELNQQKDIPSIIQLLAIWGVPFSRPLKQAYPEYVKNHALFFLELAIDSFMYPHFLKSYRRGNGDVEIVKQFLMDRIDIVNLLTLFKLLETKPADISLSDYLIDGGRRLSKDKFSVKYQDLPSQEALLRALRESLADQKWIKVLNRVFHEDLALLEEELDYVVAEELGREALRKPLSIAVPLYYIQRKYREVKNLRFIARVKEFNIPNSVAMRYIK